MATRHDGVPPASVDAVLSASRALVAVAARSLAAVADRADVVEIRALAVVAARGTASLREVADELGLHVSTASRLCDRMVNHGLLERRDDPADRRQLALRPTPEGTRLVARMRRRRRRAVEAILARMPVDDRDRLTVAFATFAAAAGDVAESDLLALGWAH